MESIKAGKTGQFVNCLLRKCHGDQVPALAVSRESAPRREMLRLRHLQASARELIREAARERGVRAQDCLLPNAAAPCHHLPAAKVRGNGRSGHRVVPRSAAEREGHGAVSQASSHSLYPALPPAGLPASSADTRHQGATRCSGWAPGQACPLKAQGEPSWLQSSGSAPGAGQRQRGADGHADCETR